MAGQINAGTLIAFRIGVQDAKMIAAELGLENHRTLRETANYRAWVRLILDGMPTEPRFMHLAEPPERGKKFKSVVAFARNRHMVPRGKADAAAECFLTNAIEPQLLAIVHLFPPRLTEFHNSATFMNASAGLRVRRQVEHECNFNNKKTPY